MPRLTRLWLTVLMTSCCAISGCGLTLGPTVRTEYVVLHAGKPMQVLSQTTVTGRVLDGSGDAVTQDIGGWVVMPTDHWDAVQRALKKGQ